MAEKEAKPNPFPHGPDLSGTADAEHFFRYLGRDIRFSPETPEEQKLRLLSDQNQLPPYFRMLFTNLFPDRLAPKPFNIESVTPTRSTELSPQEKEVRRILEEHMGFVTHKRKAERGEKPGPEDVWALGVAFTNNTRCITTLLNNLPGFRRLGLIGQTDPRLRSVEDHRPTDPRLTISRADHSKDLALMISRTNFTMAMKTPGLYIERVQTDLARYGKLYAHAHNLNSYTIPLRIHPDSRQAVQMALSAAAPSPDEGNTDPVLKIRALEYAIEYTKYQIIGAYLHDLKTPAWGDIFMKAKPEIPGQKSIVYSEDDALFALIDRMILQERSGLPHVIHRFSLNPVLLSTMIKSLASEGDPCLPGELMKAKRKYSDRVLTLFPHLSTIHRHASYDHDQRSGTKTNAENVISQYLPGGFIHMHRTHAGKEPVGSFEERARLLLFSIMAGATKADLTNACTQLGIDPNRLFMAAEEIDFGPNLELRPVNIPYDNPDTRETELRREVMPVATRPGDVKKAILMFNILSMAEYQSPSRAAGESLLQDLITSTLWGENSQDQRHITEDDFIHGTDASLADKLDAVAPVIPWIMETFMDKGVIMTEEELEKLAHAKGNLFQNYLVKPCSMKHLPLWKEGTLVMTEGGSVKPYLDVIKHHRNEPETTINTDSLPARLADVAAALRANRLFFVIALNSENLQSLGSIVSQDSPTVISIRRGLSLWTRPVIIKNQTIRNSLHDALNLPSQTSGS